MSIERRPLHPMFGFEVLDVDITKKPDAAAVSFIGKAITDGGVVLIRNPREEVANEEQLVQFATSFGPIHELPLSKSQKDDVGGNMSHTLRVTNLDRDGKIFSPDNRMQRLAVYNQYWHSDTTYVRPRTSFSFLLGKTIPPVGGETEFCDTRVAYETLPMDLRDRIDGLVAHHSITGSRAMFGFTDWKEEEKHPSVPRPIVQTHKPTGRTALCIAAHICGIEGFDQPEGMALIGELIERASTPDRTYSHHWRKGDLIIWDNRCTMHRAAPYDAKNHARELRAVRLVDTADA